jgi:hypothetical protein
MSYRNPRAGRLAPKRLLLLLGLPVLVVLGVGCWVMGGAGPEQVARQFLVAETRHDYPAMLALIPGADAAQVRTELGGTLPPPLPNAPLPTLVIGKAILRGKYAYVPLTSVPAASAHQADEHPTPEQVALVKSWGRWKVDLALTNAANSAPEGEMGEDQPGSGPLKQGAAGQQKPDDD